MRSFLLLFLLLFLTGCIAGDFGPERERLYEINSDKEICEKMPERCTEGISW